MNKYTLDVVFSFKGNVTILADSEAEAREIFNKHFSVCLGRDIQTGSYDEEVAWAFPVHPEKQIFAVKKDKSATKTCHQNFLKV